MAKLNVDLEVAHAKLRRMVFDKVYGDFAASTRDIAAALDIGVKDAKILCDELRDADLITGTEQDGQGGFGTGMRGHRTQSLVWQCWHTYDTHTEEEHEREYFAAYPSEISAQPQPKYWNVMVFVPSMNKWMRDNHNPLTTDQAETLNASLIDRKWQTRLEPCEVK